MNKKITAITGLVSEFINENKDVDIRVKVYESDDDILGMDEFQVEINYYVDSNWENSISISTHYSLRFAMEKAKEVLSTVQQLFDGTSVYVDDEVEHYGH